MNALVKIAAVTIAATGAMLMATTPAAARGCSSGFLTSLACDVGIIDKKTAKTIDRAHAQMGNPLDSVPGRVLDSYAPGAGTFYDAVRPYPGPYNPTPASYPQPQGYAPGPMYSQPMPQMSGVCVTPAGSNFIGMAPVGTPCWLNTPYGQVNGYIR